MVVEIFNGFHAAFLGQTQNKVLSQWTPIGMFGTFLYGRIKDKIINKTKSPKIGI
jgi:hypothetical protein